MKIVIVKMEVSDEDFEDAKLEVARHGDVKSDRHVMADAIQTRCYDDGWMFGDFIVVSVEDGAAQ